MSGPESKSKSETQITSTNAQSNLESLITAPTAYSGAGNAINIGEKGVYAARTGNITIIDEFSDNTTEVFQSLIELVNDAGAAAIDFGEGALQAVSRREEQVSNPELATLTKLMPLLIVGVGLIGVVSIFRIYRGK